MAELVGNVKSDTSELVKAYYDRTALKTGKPFAVLEQFAVKSRNIPRNTGDTVEWWKPIPLTVTVAALTYEGTSPAADDLEFQKSTATVETHGKVIAVSEFLGMIAIDPDLSSKVQTLGRHREEYINRMYWEALAKNLYPMRIDASATYETTGAEDGTATETTVVIGDASLSTACSAGGVIVVTSGNNEGMGGYISSYADPAITISTTKPSYALNEACTVGDTFKTANSTGLTSANPLTCAGVSKAIVILMSHSAVPVEGGYYAGILSPFTQYDIRNDSSWINANQYAGSKRLFNNEIGEWGGIRFAMDTKPWRSTAGTMGTYAAAGAVFHTPIFGQECYAGVKINGVQSQLIFHDKTQVADALELYSTAGWKARLACKVLNACWGVQVLSGATSIS